jgi:carboxyl-terminal processing protease
MKNKNVIWGVLGVVVLLGACCVAAFAGAALYFVREGRAQDFFDDPAGLFQPTPQVQVFETETPLGSDLDLASFFAPMWESRSFLHENFVEQPVDDAALAEGALLGLTTALEDAGVDLAQIEVPESAPSVAEIAVDANIPTEVSNEFRPYFEAWRKVQYGGLTADTSYEELFQASLGQMVAALGDEHTAYMDPFEVRQSDLSLQGEYEGIGAWVDTTGEFVTIIAPMEGSPAEAAGLQPGDTVLAVDGQDMAGLDGNAVISYILGPAGSQVTLTIEREGEPEPFDVTITRAAIFVPSLESEMLEGDIAYVQLFTFGADTADELHTALDELLSQNPRGLIFDLRNNGGGFLDTAVDISSEFLGSDVILYEEYADGSRETYEARPGGLATEIPLIVLVNQGSASASEIVAGAIQDQGRGQLVGETTFGKGSVQITKFLSNNQGALRITIARWLTPDERQIHGIGLEPDVVVPLTQEDFDAGNDPQLEAAIELLNENN